MIRWIAYSRYQAALDLVVRAECRRVLDFGCWDGHFLPTLLDHFPEVWGVDDDSSSLSNTLPGCWTILSVARGRARGCDSRLGLVKATGAQLPFPDSCFDVVFAVDTLVHVVPEARSEVLSELARITAPGGQLIVALPVETGLVGTLKRVARKVSGKRIDGESAVGDIEADIERVGKVGRIVRQGWAPPNRLGRCLPASLLFDCRPG